MNFDELVEKVEQDLGFPVTKDELVDRFGDLEIEGSDETIPLREYIDERDDPEAPERAEETDRRSPTSFDSPKHLESFLW